MNKNQIEEKIFIYLSKLSAYLLLCILIFVILTLSIKGIPHLTWDLISKNPQGGFYLGKKGGVFNAIVGSLYISLGGVLLGFFFSIATAVFINIYLPPRHWVSRIVRFIVEILTGIPALIYGAFGLMIMYVFKIQASLGAGIFTVGLLVFPIMTRIIDEIMRTVPREFSESAAALGATNFEICWKVVLRKIFPGMITALLIGFGRAIGDAASVLFTAGFSDNIPSSLNQPTATLPLSIFFQLTSPIPEVQNRAYATAVILVFLILSISLLARYFSKIKERY